MIINTKGINTMIINTKGINTKIINTKGINTMIINTKSKKLKCLDECLIMIKIKAHFINFVYLTKNVGDFIYYFEKKNMD